MTFSEKLTFLMNLAPVKNAELARALHIDPSQISRLRNGTRKAPRKPELLGVIASYFAKRCEDDYQRAALAEVMGEARARYIADEDEQAEALLNWLREGDAEPRASAETSGDKHRSDSVRILYGNASKRRYVKETLKRLNDQQAPCTLMIASDENREWFTEDAEFARETAEMLLSLAQRGFTIERIIPRMTTMRDMQESFALWLSLYLTGNVKPYYLPSLRDGIIKRTLFVAQGAEAMFSVSIGNQGAESVAYAVSGQRAVENCAREFRAYRALCSPAIRAMDPLWQHTQLRESIDGYYGNSAASIRMYNGLSLISMPNDMRRLLGEKARGELVRLLCRHTFEGYASYEQTLFSRVNIDIIRLATNEEARAGEARMFLDELRYTPEMYKDHLRNVITLMERYEDYHVAISDNSRRDCAIYAKRDVGALVFMANAPYLALDILAPDMYHGLWEYLEMESYTELTAEANKRRVIEKLRGAIAKLS